LVFKRKTKERIIEAKKPLEIPYKYNREEDVRNKLGISSTAPDEKID